MRCSSRRSDNHTLLHPACSLVVGRTLRGCRRTTRARSPTRKATEEVQIGPHGEARAVEASPLIFDGTLVLLQPLSMRVRRRLGHRVRFRDRGCEGPPATTLEASSLRRSFHAFTRRGARTFANERALTNVGSGEKVPPRNERLVRGARRSLAHATATILGCARLLERCVKLTRSGIMVKVVRWWGIVPSVPDKASGCSRERARFGTGQ